MPDTALLVMDVQNAITQRVTDDGYLPRLARAVGAARDAGVPVLYVVIGFRPGDTDYHPDNKVFGQDRGMGAAPGALDVHAAVAPREGEPVITKKRISGFAGSDLELVLRSNGIRHLVLTGVATSGVVLSTLREAADLDYRITVPSDGCHDFDEEVHRVLMEKVFPMQADVTTIDDWVRGLA